jgi:hypothetical protein
LTDLSSFLFSLERQIIPFKKGNHSNGQSSFNMRFLSTAALSVAALTGLSQAVGNAIVQNECSFPVYVWSVGSTISQEYTVNSGQQFSEVFYVDPKSGGIAIKITTDPKGLSDGAPQTIFAYTLDGSNVWYDASDVFGDAFSGYPVTLIPSDASCPSLVWPNGVPPAGSEVKVCESNTNLTFTLC